MLVGYPITAQEKKNKNRPTALAITYPRKYVGAYMKNFGSKWLKNVDGPREETTEKGRFRCCYFIKGFHLFSNKN